MTTTACPTKLWGWSAGSLWGNRSGRAPSRSTTGWAGREPTAGTTSPTQPGRASRVSRRSSTSAECIRPGRGGEMGKHNSLREGAKLGLVVATSPDLRREPDRYGNRDRHHLTRAYARGTAAAS